jgi:hypothetical protein
MLKVSAHEGSHVASPVNFPIAEVPQKKETDNSRPISLEEKR